MFDVAREVFVCASATDVPAVDDAALGLAFRLGTVDDLARLDDAHDAATLVALRARIDGGDTWLVGERDGAIVTYTWLASATRVEYPSLPGCAFSLRDDVGYGYGAWTTPSARGRGYRRHAFVAELRLLAARGKRWEASVFTAAQLAPATGSLRRVGIVVEPLLRVTYTRSRRAELTRLVDDDRVRCL